ncbi:hypothetical protein [Flavobacterium psychrotolerans]|uniref:Uncharacterized protein n=1 Tax=Flavobacterium psychrotolerans TaxID=2169410 RepID=A0A2U1JKC2_9FLAO|nr:hypothetical protein [Flavobacterium psychrotolerans]PWA05597.1 hypothetical protein DB895_06340 [Flavobacterium psychrotolerans]
MRNLSVQLRNGRKITIEGFNMIPTYSGLISGEPDEELNHTILKKTSYPSAWGERKVVYKQANIKISDTELKPFIYSAWLTSKPINDKKNQFDGSSIIMVWYGNEPKNKSIQEIILVELENFDLRHFENYNI